METKTAETRRPNAGGTDPWKETIKKALFPQRVEVAPAQKNHGLSRAQITEELKNPELAAMVHYFLSGDPRDAAIKCDPEADPVKERERVESNANKLKAHRFLSNLGVGAARSTKAQVAK